VVKLGKKTARREISLTQDFECFILRKSKGGKDFRKVLKRENLSPAPKLEGFDPNRSLIAVLGGGKT